MEQTFKLAAGQYKFQMRFDIQATDILYNRKILLKSFVEL